MEKVDGDRPKTVFMFALVRMDNGELIKLPTIDYKIPSLPKGWEFLSFGTN